MTEDSRQIEAKTKEMEAAEVSSRAQETEDSRGGVRTRIEIETRTAPPSSPAIRNKSLVFIACVALVALVTILALVFGFRGGEGARQKVKAGAEEVAGQGEKKEGGEANESRDVVLSPEAIKAAGIEVAGVTQRPAVTLRQVTGAVETNQQQTQAATPLVGGRVERVSVALGDRVRAGQILATIASPEIAEMRGKLREAQTRLGLAQRNRERVQRAENRVAVLSAKAKLDEAEATLKRTRRLIELGVGAGKDLISAETAYKTAKAEFDFQSNISLSREVQEAQAEVDTARAEVTHLEQSLQMLGASSNGSETSTALITVRAPVSGTVTERLVNPGAGVESGKTLFTIANISTVWVIANVPEAQVGSLRTGTPAEVRSATLGAGALSGRISYIEPQLDQETHTARVRVEVANAGERLKPGMFVEVGFQAGTGQATGEELVIPSEAVQKIGDRTVVFIPEEDEPGHFKMRDVELGVEVGGYRRILSGLTLEDKVVTKGSFTLKSQAMKSQFGEDVD
jgi:cobalt-zinc-cadmium efflux system membrane fusion protein